MQMNLDNCERTMCARDGYRVIVRTGLSENSEQRYRSHGEQFEEGTY